MNRVLRAAALWCLVGASSLMIVGPATAQDAGGKRYRVYVSDIHDLDDGEQAGGSAAMSIAGVRGGVFSAKVVVESPQAVEGLKATAGDLAQGSAVIPASRIAIRYGMPWDTSIGSHYRPRGNDILLASPPAGQATIPIWVTVAVPREAKPGRYAGRLVVEAKGEKPVAVPLALNVADWILPETQRWRTWIELIQSPDTLAMEYGVPMWSDRHWQMIARSMRLIGQTGSRVVYVPLICNTNMGNSESMVRWVPTGDERYDHDFSVMEKYLDLAEEHMGKPKLVVFYVWEVYLRPPKEEVVISEGDSDYIRMEKSKAAARWALRDKGPAVSVMNPRTKAVETVYLPPYAHASSKRLWQPLWAELRKRMEKRGLAGTMMLGVISDVWPTKEEVVFLKDVSSGLPWTSCSHHARWLQTETSTPEGALYKEASVGYTAAALDFQYTINPAKDRTYGWKKPILHGQYWRFQFFNASLLNAVRSEAERNITGWQRGLARIGADFWYAMKDKRGRRVATVAERYNESYWHSLNIGGWLLGPGPDGPVATARFEVFREGVQECEARILIESALTTPAAKGRLGAELAKRAQQVLDERQVALWKARGATQADLDRGLVPQYREIYGMAKGWDEKGGQRWFMESNWQGRTAALYTVAGEVARKLGGN